MKIEEQLNGGFLVLRLDGRLDGASSPELQARLDRAIDEQGVRQVVLDLPKLQYLSSAGIRVLVSGLKRLRAGGGDLILTGLHGYSEEVLKLAGFDKLLTRFGSVEEAEAQLVKPQEVLDWDQAGAHRDESGTYRILHQSDGRANVLVLGHIEDVLYSRVTPELIQSRPFSSIEYSLGCGGLGGKMEDYLPVMGEMITIGGTMVWLPTDGNDTPDFLIPQTDSETVTVRTNFNVALQGPWQEVILFESARPNGSSMTEIYRSLFEFIKSREDDFRGGLVLSMRAEMPEVYGSGVTKSPILENAPADGEMITHANHFSDWFEIDKEPRHRNVTGLIAGIGIDLTTDLSLYDPEVFGSAFYVNPGNKGASDQVLHNHAVFFHPLSFPRNPKKIDDEVVNVVRDGNFLDMRHLLDASTVSRAVIGLSRIHNFVKDTSARPGHQ